MSTTTKCPNCHELVTIGFFDKCSPTCENGTCVKNTKDDFFCRCNTGFTGR